MRQEPPLTLETTPISGERSVRADDAMTGNDDRDRVRAVREPDGTHGFGIAQAPRELTVTEGLAGRNCAERRPHAALEFRAVGLASDLVECFETAREIVVE